MRLVVTQNITLDGVIDATEGWFTPAEGEDQSDVLELIQEWMPSESAMLLGRKTFEDFRSYWPLQTDDRTGITDQLNRVEKYVVSSSLGDPGWENTTVLPDLVDEARALKEQPGDDMITTGSISLMQPLIDAGLVDEYRLFVFPVVLGRGARLFADVGARLELLETRAFRAGITLLRYRPV